MYLTLHSFRCHIRFSPGKGLEFTNILESTEAKIDEFKVTLIVEQNVLELDVAVNDPLLVEVFERVK